VRTLYLCYFGLREPLVQSQVLPYLRQLSKSGVDVSLLTFEADKKRKWSAAEIEEWRRKLEVDGIKWYLLPYHKRPSLPATAYDIIAGAWTAARLARRLKIDVLHARTHVPMAMGLLAQKLTGCKLVFDIRGLVAEEYADAGVWTEDSLPYRIMKRLERFSVRKADQVIVLTKRMRDWLVEQQLAEAGKIEVIPCCVDFSLFDERQITNGTKPAERFEVIYAGSVTGLYMLEEMAQFFLVLREKQQNAFFRILTKSAPDETGATLQRLGLQDSDFWVGSVAPHEVSTYLRGARLGLSFRKPTFSQIAASPTKIPEYLAAGIPVVCNALTGDMDMLLEEFGVGVIVRDFTQEVYRSVAEAAISLANDERLPVRCRQVARQNFDLETVGGAAYKRVYEKLKKP